MSRPRALTVCAEPGCHELTDTGRCDPHARAAASRTDRHRPNSRRRGYDAEWEATRAEYIDAHPWCEAETHTPNCNGKAECVDHIDGLGPSGPKGHDHSNLQSLSTSCHSSKTNRLDGGGWPTRPS